MDSLTKTCLVSKRRGYRPHCLMLQGWGWGGVAGDKVVGEHVGQIVTLVPFGGSIIYHNNSLWERKTNELCLFFHKEKRNTSISQLMWYIHTFRTSSYCKVAKFYILSSYCKVAKFYILDNWNVTLLFDSDWPAGSQMSYMILRTWTQTKLFFLIN